MAPGNPSSASKGLLNTQTNLRDDKNANQHCLFRAPGFGMPLNYYPGIEVNQWTIPVASLGQPFPDSLCWRDIQDQRTTLPLLTLRETDMLRVMNSVTDKPEWHRKVFDPAITQKWTNETLSNESLDVTARMMAWIIDELKYKAKVYQKTSMISVFNGDVIKSDVALSHFFKEKLQAAVKPLEDIPDKMKDWHPGSNDQVLDLVHPSLFPLVYGRSRVLEECAVSLVDCVSQCGSGVVVPIPPRPEALDNHPRDLFGNGRTAYSRNFQWLPCEVDISHSAIITSYINNLHPERNEELYGLVGEAIEAAIPLWDHCLSALVERKWKPRIFYKGAYDRVYRPEIGKFTPPRGKPSVDLRKQFAVQGLQVIVKLANIVLTPEKPDYPGGSWHVEGQLNEHICATALYYYSNENIESSTLAFRQQSDTTHADKVKYTQNDHRFLQEVFGCSNDQPGVQVVGGVETLEGRLLVFPNILQHQVQPFGLKDRTQSGHRKILALFLVDPHFRILSTANVPPQQKEWWSERLTREEANALGDARRGLGVLPDELRDMVFSHIRDDFPVGLDEAKVLREALMEERKEVHLSQDKAFNYERFSLCEH